MACDAVNEMLLAAPDGVFIELFPFFPRDEPASFTTLRSKGGWLVSANQSARGLVSGVVIVATVDDTCHLIDPWRSSDSGDNSHMPAVSCEPSPAAPSVVRTSVGGRDGVLSWNMTAGQSCNVDRS